MAACLLLAGCWKSVSQQEELVAQLKHKDARQRRTAALLIRDLRPVPESYLVPLIQALNDSDPEVRLSAAEALGEIGGCGRSKLTELAKLSNEHQDPQVRFALQQSVSKINTSQ